MLTDEQIKERNRRFNKRNKNFIVAFIGLGFSILCYILWFLIVIITVLLGSFHVKIPPQAFFDDLMMWLPVYLASVGASIAGLAIIKNIFDFIFSKDPTKFWRMDKQNTYVDLEFQQKIEEKYKRIVKEDIQKNWDNGKYLYDILYDLCENKYVVPYVDNNYKTLIGCFAEEIAHDLIYKEQIWRKNNNLPKMPEDAAKHFNCLFASYIYFEDEDVYDENGDISYNKLRDMIYYRERLTFKYEYIDNEKMTQYSLIEDYNLENIDYSPEEKYKGIGKIPSDLLLEKSISNNSLVKRVVSELTEKELAENRICYSPFHEESDWQQREKDNQEIIEYKEKYPWKNKYRKL